MKSNDDSYIRVIFERDEFKETIFLHGDFSAWRLSVIEEFARSRLKKSFPCSFRPILDEYEIKSIEFM